MFTCRTGVWVTSASTLRAMTPAAWRMPPRLRGPMR